MQLLKTSRHIVLILLLSLVSISTYANTVTYEITFDGSQIGPAGTGSFVWDTSSLTMTSLNWELGEDVSGSVPNFLLANEFFTGTLGQALFEAMTGQDVHPFFDASFVVNIGGGLSGTFPNGELALGGVDSMFSPLSYELRSDNPINPDFIVVGQGIYSVTPIPLPPALLLMITALGFFGVLSGRGARSSAHQ